MFSRRFQEKAARFIRAGEIFCRSFRAHRDLHKKCRFLLLVTPYSYLSRYLVDKSSVCQLFLGGILNSSFIRDYFELNRGYIAGKWDDTCMRKPQRKFHVAF